MALLDLQKTPVAEQATESQKILCVAAICALASLPLALSVALTIWGA